MQMIPVGLTIPDPMKISFGIAINDCILFLEGNQVSTDTTTADMDFAVETLMFFGNNGASGKSWNGHTREVAYSIIRESDAVLASVTAP